MVKKEYCIIGIDGFSLEVAKILHNAGLKVILIDIDQEKVDALSSTYEFVFKADATNIASLQDLNVDQFSGVIVGVSTMEDSILIVSNLKQLKVKNIIAKVKSGIQKKVLSILAGNNIKIIWPEESIAELVGFRLIHNIALDIALDTDGVSIIKIPVTNEQIFGVPIKNFEIKSKFAASIIMINRDSDLIFPIRSTTELLKDDIVTVACRSDMTDELISLFLGDS